MNRFWFVFGAALLFYPAVPQFGVALMGDGSWPGHTKSLDITIIDIAALAYLLSQPGALLKQKTPFGLWMKIYFATAVIAWLHSEQFTISFYYIFQLMRGYIVYLAVSHACKEERRFESLMSGLAVGLVYELGLVLFQKYVQHAVQPVGTFGHQNGLGIVTNMLVISFATPLFGHVGRPVRYFATIAGMAIPAIIASRAVAGLGLASMTFSFLMSVWRKPSARKGKFALAGVLMVVIMFPIAMSSFNARFKGENWNGFSEGDYDERAAYKAAAEEMLADHPWGIGPNNFVVVANMGGYYARAKVEPNDTSLRGHVHHIYLLTACELGYPGAIALVMLFAATLIKGFRASLRLAGTRDAEYIGGFTAGLAYIYVHSLVEWGLVVSDPQYALIFVMAMLSGVLMRNQTQLAKTSAKDPAIVSVQGDAHVTNAPVASPARSVSPKQAKVREYPDPLKKFRH